MKTWRDKAHREIGRLCFVFKDGDVKVRFDVHYKDRYTFRTKPDVICLQEPRL